MKKIAVLGSTGSIGTQTLRVIRESPEKYRVTSLAAYQNQKLLDIQCREFSPLYSGLISQDKFALHKAVQGADLVVVATSGITAIPAVLDAIGRGADVALANKETMVAAGSLIKEALKNSKSRLIPVDSEHSAVFQCIESAGEKPKRIILTASGGALRGKTLEELKSADYQTALKHPNWNMGEKITIDSATMFNKTLEVIEAKWFFDMPVSKIDILVHPQSLVHSMIELEGGRVLGQVAPPSMLMPIEYALSYPAPPKNIREIDIAGGEFEFSPPDNRRFPCAGLAYGEIMDIPLMPTVMNASNDVCVEMFRQKQLCFTGFWNIISSTCEHFYGELRQTEISVQNIARYDRLAKKHAAMLIRKN